MEVLSRTFSATLELQGLEQCLVLLWLLADDTVSFTLDMLSNLSKPLFPHLECGHDDGSLLGPRSSFPPSDFFQSFSAPTTCIRWVVLLWTRLDEDTSGLSEDLP